MNYAYIFFSLVVIYLICLSIQGMMRIYLTILNFFINVSARLQEHEMSTLQQDDRHIPYRESPVRKVRAAQGVTQMRKVRQTL